MKRIIFAAAAALSLSFANAVEVEGFKFDDQLKLGNADLVINGTGVRSKFGKRYAMALYLPTKAGDAKAALAAKGAKRIDYISVMVTNLALIAIVVAASLTIGFRTYLLVQLPVLVMAATLGIWLFFIQHQYQGVYWARHDQWDPWRMAMEGASFYCLPKPLQWATGNIGFHHVHHMRPGIPNYNLEQCYREVPQLQQVTPVTLLSSLESLQQQLYDEERQRMVSFREARGISS